MKRSTSHTQPYGKFSRSGRTITITEQPCYTRMVFNKNKKKYSQKPLVILTVNKNTFECTCHLVIHYYLHCNVSICYTGFMFCHNIYIFIHITKITRVMYIYFEKKNFSMSKEKQCKFVYTQTRIKNNFKEVFRIAL